MKARPADLFRLIRIPMAFTTVGDVLVGLLCVRLGAGGRPPLLPDAALLILSSACLYSFGMVTNDIFDRLRDRVLHPARPIPSGRVGVKAAWGIALFLLVAALGLALGIGRMSLAWAGGMAVLILAYNAGIKRLDFLGSSCMGTIRGANVLFGWTALGEAIDPGLLAGVAPAVYVLFYISSTTLISTAEDLPAPRRGGPRRRILASFGMIAVVLGVASYPGLPAPMDPVWPLMIIIGWRLLLSRDPSTATTGQTVRYLLIGLFFLDAHILYAAGYPMVAAFVLSMVLPSLYLSRLLRVAS